ncbi:MAG: DUF4194 domain-containing protein [Verrucomicrobiales bacterium]|nr:DUF4194 domain-containing protein [Verrucomicrobiales bacterium]
MEETFHEPEAANQALDLPDYQSWSLAAVKLLQDVVYSLDDVRVWSEILRSRNRIQDYFARIGLVLVVDESNGYAYLRQLDTDNESLAKEYADLPKLYRQSRLGYGASLICVILREALRRYESEEFDSDLCVVEEDELFEQWKVFFPEQSDEKKQFRDFIAALRQASEAGFARKLPKTEPAAWEVRRIIKAKLNAQRLEQLRDDLKTFLEQEKEKAADTDQ